MLTEDSFYFRPIKEPSLFVTTRSIQVPAQRWPFLIKLGLLFAAHRFLSISIVNLAYVSTWARTWFIEKAETLQHTGTRVMSACSSQKHRGEIFPANNTNVMDNLNPFFSCQQYESGLLCQSCPVLEKKTDTGSWQGWRFAWKEWMEEDFCQRFTKEERGGVPFHSPSLEWQRRQWKADNSPRSQSQSQAKFNKLNLSFY